MKIRKVVLGLIGLALMILGAVHQGFGQEEKAVQAAIEEILKEKGYDPKAYQTALETGKGKKRVEEDLSLGNKLRVSRTPTTLINGEFVRNPVTENLLNQYLKK